ncbi:MAG: glycogen synthase, partial [Verrucomicrobiaceae bacterium]
MAWAEVRATVAMHSGVTRSISFLSGTATDAGLGVCVGSHIKVKKTQAKSIASCNGDLARFLPETPHFSYSSCWSRQTACRWINIEEHPAGSVLATDSWFVALLRSHIAMTILLAASEMDPLARTGGLGDVLEALPAALQDAGHEVSVVLPCYRGLRDRPGLVVKSTGVKIPVQIRDKQINAEILECMTPAGVQVFLIRQDEYFDREGIYGVEGGAYDDNAERFIFFSKAVVELARRILPPPEVIHVHDWQTALIPVLVKERRLPFKTVLTIHNLAYQGSFWAFDFGLTGLPGDYFAAGKGVEYFGNMNLLKGGIVYADAVTTVSDRYAREIQTPEYGAGLDPVVKEHAAKLTGILNGADYSRWSPETDRLIPQNYSSENLAGKQTCRAALLNHLGLAPTPQGPVFSMVSRLASQKGIDLLLPVIDRLLSND